MPAGMPREHNRKEIIHLQSQPLALRTVSAQKNQWLQIGCNILIDSLKSAQNMDFVDKKRTENRVYHRRKGSGSEAGMMRVSRGNLDYPVWGKILYPVQRLSLS